MVYNNIRQCAIYIAYTNFEHDYLVQHRVDTAKIKVIGGGIEPERYSKAERNTVRQRLGWGDELVIVSVAQHLAHKRLDLLITAMPRVWETVPDARLVIVGLSRR